MLQPRTTILTIGVPEGSVAGAELGLRATDQHPHARGPDQVIERRRTGATATRRELDVGEQTDCGCASRCGPSVTFHDGTPLDVRARRRSCCRRAIARPGNRVALPVSQRHHRRSRRWRTASWCSTCRSRLRSYPRISTLPLESSRIRERRNRSVSSRASGIRAEVVLERFDDYYLGAPQIRRVVIRPFDTLRTAWASLLRGEVDMVTDVPPEAVEFVRNDDVEVISFRAPLSVPDRVQFAAAAVRRRRACGGRSTSPSIATR